MYENRTGHPLIIQLFHGTTDEKLQAAYDLGICTEGLDFDPAPFLFRALVEMRDDGVPEEAACALAKMRAQGLQWIIRGLGFKIDSVRYACAHALRLFGGSWAKDAVPLLRELIRNSSSEIRIEAAGAIGTIGPAAAEAVFDLAQYIGEELETSAACLIALRSLGASAKPAIPALIQLIESTNDFRRAIALRTLSEVEPDPSTDLIERILKICNYSFDTFELEPLIDLLANYCRHQSELVHRLNTRVGTLGEALDIALAIALKTTGFFSNKVDSIIEQSLYTSNLSRQKLVRELLYYAKQI
ncbi:MAG: hypothetical protein DDG59_13495 [Anaerolineae bacterium]|jgi:hypothetical protein|nr:MAG: hypothetical protein DDG59_13495 [Anaerolineae bacterium]